MNDFQKRRFAQKITENLFSTLIRKKITLLGFAFKKNTGDTRSVFYTKFLLLINFNFIRESPAIYVSKYLLDEGAHLYIYDPQVEENQVMYELSNSQLNLPIDVVKKQVHVLRDPIEACKDSHAIVILTEWDEFKVILVLFF